MSRYTLRSSLGIAAIVVLALLVAALAIIGASSWALVALGVFLALITIAIQQQLADIRGRLAQQQAATRATVRASRLIASNFDSNASETRKTTLQLRRTVAALQRDIAQAHSETKASLLHAHEQAESLHSILRSDVVGVARQLRRLQPELMTEIQAMTQLIQRYSPSARLPIVAGWALSPAGLLYLTDSIEASDAAFVVECGSGTSTLWMALAMRRKGSGRVVAIEHLDEYAEKTRAMLEAHGVSEWAEVRVCPLTTVTTSRGEFQWYDIDPASLGHSIDILLVDGPPATTGSHARYPALPRLGLAMSATGIIVVDDAERVDEREMVEYWLEEMPNLSRADSPGPGVRVLRAG